MSSKLKEETMFETIIIRFSRHISFLTIAFFLLLWLPGQDALCKPQARNRGTVVIDPGHGGSDRGAVGPDGTYEKNMSLRLAMALKAGLENRYRVVLTRSGDYRTALSKRVELANSEQAVLFVSIHAGGGFARGGNILNVFYYEDKQFASLQADGSSAVSAAPAVPVQEEWRCSQQDYASKSRVLASRVSLAVKAGQVYDSVAVWGMPMELLSGAGMPAILVEAGNLANPVDEKQLNDPLFLEKLARAVVAGIDGFLKRDE